MRGFTMRGFGRFSRSLDAIAREGQRAHSAALALQRAQLREQQTAAKVAAKTAQKDDVDARIAEADDMTNVLEADVEHLGSILRAAATKSFALDFEKLKLKPKKLQSSFDGLDEAEPAPIESDFRPATLNFIQRLVPQLVQRYDQAVIDGPTSYQEVVAHHQARESERLSKLEGLKVKHAERISRCTSARCCSK